MWYFVNWEVVNKNSKSMILLTNNDFKKDEILPSTKSANILILGLFYILNVYIFSLGADY